MKRLFFMTGTAVALLFATTFAIAQRAQLTEGDLDALKGIKKINVQFDYSKMDVGKKSEQDYIADKKEEYNSEEPGRGNRWEKDWIADRKKRFEPRFVGEFNDNGDIRAGNFPMEKYTMIFKTVFTEPGYNVGVMRKNASIDGQAWIVETANPDKVIAKLEINNCPGRTFMGGDYETGQRIQEAYAMAGKGLGRFFSKNVE